MRRLTRTPLLRPRARPRKQGRTFRRAPAGSSAEPCALRSDYFFESSFLASPFFSSFLPSAFFSSFLASAFLPSAFFSSFLASAAGLPAAGYSSF